MKKIIFFLVLSSFAFTLHKYHLSNTKIVFKQENELVNITMRYFVDDIETAINKANDTITELGTKREIAVIDTVLNNYIQSNFSIKINSDPIKINYLGKEIEKDIIYFYLEADNIKKIQSIYIGNTMLLSTFNDQQNVTKLHINNKKKSFVLKNGNTFKKIQW